MPVGVGMNGATQSARDTVPDCNVDDIRRTFLLMRRLPNQVTELRCLKTRWKTLSGYSNDLDKLVALAVDLNGRQSIKAVYLTANPPKPDLVARSKDRITEWAENTTADGDIVHRFWFPIASTPNPIAGISSTNAEHEASLVKAKRIARWLVDHGVPENSIILGDSGNGAHVLAAIDLPNDDDSTNLLQKCIAVVAHFFAEHSKEIDKTVYSAAQMWKLYGTMARKGDNLPERPHRLSRLVYGPKNLAICPVDALRAIAAELPEPTKKTAYNGNGKVFDIEQFISEHLIVKHEKDWNGNRMWILAECPFNAEHNYGEVHIQQFPSGAVQFACKHNGCSDKRWQDVREKYEPGYRDKSYSTGGEQSETSSSAGEPSQKGKVSAWDKAKAAPDFCAEEDKEIAGYAKALLYPETITTIAAPRGIGKTLVLHALAVAIAKGEYFRGEKVNSLRVLLVDRDNPRQVVRQRIRGWGGGALDAKNLKVLTREDAPDLREKAAWEAFPVADYDVVLIDSLGSFTEGVTEKEGKETTQMLATLLDFIRKGPAVVALTNCTKDALKHSRSR